MPALIFADPMKRYKKKRLLCSTHLRTKLLVERNQQDYILVMAPLKGADSAPNNIERIVQNILRLSHPHIVSVYEGYLWKDKCYWIMKDWTKGIRRGIGGTVMGEREIARIIFQLCSALRCMHEAGIPHGNLSFEDIHFFQCLGEIDFKIADLGLSRFVDQESYTEISQDLKYGSPPEARLGQFTSAGDVWTVGSVTFRLLTGDIRQTRLLERDGDFQSDLSNVSSEARDFINKCLQINPSDRISCEDALCHPWFRAEHSQIPSIRLETIQTLRRSYVASSFKRLAAAVLCKHVEPDFVLEHLRDFERINVSGSGVISYEEFMAAFVGEKSMMTRTEAQKMFEYIDFKKDGRICFAEFVAACMQFRTDIPDTELLEAFDNMDGDGDGFLSPTDLSYVLDFPKHLSEKYFAEICWNKTRPRLNLEQFKALMKNDETTGVVGWARKASLELASSLPELSRTVSFASQHSSSNASA